MPPSTSTSGLERYWRKRAEREADAGGASRAAAVRRYLAGTMTQTIERRALQGPGSGLGGHWRVIVRNDDHNTFDHVAHTLARYIPGVNLDKGYAYAGARAFHARPLDRLRHRPGRYRRRGRAATPTGRSLSCSARLRQ